MQILKHLWDASMAMQINSWEGGNEIFFKNEVLLPVPRLLFTTIPLPSPLTVFLSLFFLNNSVLKLLVELNKVGIHSVGGDAQQPQPGVSVVNMRG